MNTADDPRGFVVLLHPHPAYGGNRFHPFVDGLFHRLPAAGASAIRFDFTSAEAAAARQQVMDAIDEGASRWPEVPAIVVGYSFGAGVAASVDDGRIVGWYLLAPQVEALEPVTSTIGMDRRPKAIAVPEYDQFSPPERVRTAVSGWEATTLTTVAQADHFLGRVDPVVDATLVWIESILNG